MFFMQIFKYFMNDLFYWMVNGLICLIVFYITRFYLRLSYYPKGPFPLPFVGNIFHVISWSYINKGRNPVYQWDKLKDKYGPVFTLWFTTMPVVFITDLQLLKEAFQHKGKDFSNRRLKFMEYIITSGKGKEIAFSDFGPTWAVLRKVTHTAVKKYSVKEELAKTVSKITDEAVENIRKNGFDKPIDFGHHLNLIMISLIMSLIFGKNYTLDDEEFLHLKSLIEKFNESLDISVIIEGLHGIIQNIYKKFGDFSCSYQITEICKSKFNQHLNTYKPGVIRDLADALIAAREEAIIENKEDANILNIQNISNVMWDLFVAGVNTSLHELEWAFLLMANHHEIQIKLRKEIKSVIGDRMPSIQDKDNCHYVMAFIHECLRFKPVVPFTGHSTACDTELAKYKIPKDTQVSSFLYSVLIDPKYWDKPEVFNPNRFLTSEGKLITVKPLAYMPFGIGRRVCIGEKLAYADMFIIICKILQLTDGYLLTLPNGPGSANLDFDAKSFIIARAQKFELLLKKYQI